MTKFFWAADLLSENQALAAQISRLSGSEFEVLSELDKEAVAEDIATLLYANEGRDLPDPKRLLQQTMAIQEALEKAQAAAEAMAPDISHQLTHTKPAGRPLAEIIAEARDASAHKLHLAEKIARDELNRHPIRRGRPTDYAANFAAQAAVRIFERRTGCAATVSADSDGHPRSEFSLFLDAVFGCLDVEHDFRKIGANAIEKVHQTRRAP